MPEIIDVIDLMSANQLHTEYLGINEAWMCFHLNELVANSHPASVHCRTIQVSGAERMLV